MNNKIRPSPFMSSGFIYVALQGYSHKSTTKSNIKNHI